MVLIRYIVLVYLYVERLKGVITFMFRRNVTV